MRKFLIVSILTLILLIVPAGIAVGSQAGKDGAAPGTADKLKRFNQTSEELFRFASDGNFERALAALQLLEKQATGMSFAGVTGLEGVQALFTSLIEAKRSLAALEPDRQEVLIDAARIRLAADALLRRPQPMWHQYYRVLRDDLDALAAANAEKRTEDVRAIYAQFKTHFDVIRPALLISRSPSQTEKFVSLTAAFDAAIRTSGVRFAQVEQLLPALGALVDETFEREHEDAFVPIPDSERPALVTLVIGSVILTVLAYAGWLKYRSDPGYRTISGKGGGRRI
jgi:sporulation protein YpjB